MVIVLFAILGLFIGSFLGVIIKRTGTNQPILYGRSECPFCHTRLQAMDLIPLFSFVIAKGRCRYCKQPISFFYPIIEITTAFVFGVVVWCIAKLPVFGTFLNVFNPTQGWWVYLLILFWLFFAALLICVSFYDFFHYIIPDKFLLYGLLGAILYLIFLISVPTTPFSINTSIISHLIGAAIGFGFLGAIYFVSRGSWMGFGDVKLIGLLGLILGWPEILLATVLGFFIGGFVAILLIAFRGRSLKSQIPFGPFLALGGLIALLAGKAIAQLYLQIFII